MDLKELDSYNLQDAVELHDQLNPKLFSGEHLRPEVRAALLEIARDFQDYLGVTDLKLQDITFSGSNAAYAYTPHSDIDLHLVVDFPEDEIYRELFDAKKYQYNETHDITVRGYDVELYVQDAAQAHHSAGVYSIKDDDWVKMPRRQRVTIDDRNVKDKYETLKCQIQCVIKTQDYNKIVDLQKKIKNMRSAGLEKTGEFGPENLAFKMLRTQGLIKQLIDARNHLKSQELSIDEQLKERFVWGFSEGASGYIPKNKKEARDPRWSHAITQDIGPGEVARQAKKMGFSTDAAGVPPRAQTNGAVKQLKESTAQENRALEMDRFARFVAQELGLGAEDMPEIEYTNDINRVKDHRTFGTTTSQGQDRRIWVYLGDRNTADAMRTLAHELVHAQQFAQGQARAGMDQQQEQRIEDQANAMAGRIMRSYGQRDSSIYENQQTRKKNILTYGLQAGLIVANLKGPLSDYTIYYNPSTGQITSKNLNTPGLPDSAAVDQLMILSLFMSAKNLGHDYLEIPDSIDPRLASALTYLHDHGMITWSEQGSRTQGREITTRGLNLVQKFLDKIKAR